MSSLEDKPGRTYWRSLAELGDSEEFRCYLEAEFPEEATEGEGDGLSRRRFLQMMGASIALASLAGCRWPAEQIVPFAKRPAGYVPGEAKRFATALEIGGVAAGLLVTSIDGRPIKIEGNPDHPQSLGAASALAQAAILELYDPDRAKPVVRRAGGQVVGATWDDFIAFALPRFAALRAREGEGLAILSEATSSPSVADLRASIRRLYPRATWHQYEPLTRDNERAGTVAAFGSALRAVPRLERARVIVDLDADLLGEHPAAIRQARGFVGGRRAAADLFNRLYVIESRYSVTGAMADHRFPTASRLIPLVAGCLAAELFLARGLPLPEGAETLREWLAPLLHHPQRPAYVSALARDLMDSRRAGLIVAGPRQPAALHALVHLLNAALENAGETIMYLKEPVCTADSELDGITNLTASLRAGQVDTLMILGGNPVFDAPADLHFGEALGRAGASVHLGLFEDETSRGCGWHVPRAHALEAWGDALAWDGLYSVTQPLIEPLYGGKTPAELLSLLVDEPALSAHAIVQRTFQRFAGGGAWETSWQACLHAGFRESSGADSDGSLPLLDVPPLRADAAARAVVTGLAPDTSPPSREDLELVFAPDPRLYDGRFANNAWLQELPESLTKLTWDNAALLAPATARALGVAQDDVVRVRRGERELELPVHLVPGQAPWSVTVWLGQGRTAAGRVGNGCGADAYRLRTSDALWNTGGVTLTPTGRRHKLACTQDHHAIDARGAREREHRATHELVREADVAEFRADPELFHAAVHRPGSSQLFAEHPYTGHKWGMAIDLNACIGCNACVVACQAENNVPVVGREQVAKGREMHWLRLDRYFAGGEQSPRAIHQPVACVHCENAPCEQVCPVAATVHDSEGLNVMVYNRCVGTRYCSNNCPFKVRRFNFFNYHKDESPTEKMARNPEVTVRSRGVMEKCTYCVQRIEAAKINAKNDKRPLRDGEIVPACAQTCPAQAIVFGDLNDPESRVARLQADHRAYTLLDELQVKPRTAFLGRLRNPNPEIAELADEDGAH